MANDMFLRHIATKYGTGLASRADTAGNHTVAASLTDAFAQNGQSVPQTLVPAVQELNEITQREVALSKTTPDARAALAGTGYDPLASQKRAGELEQFLLTNSAEARNASSAADLRSKQAQAVALENSNAMVSATFDAQVDQNLSAMALQTETNNANLSAINEGKGVRQAEMFAAQTGKSLDDLYEIFSTNNPAALMDAFGTGDRYIAHQTLRHMQIGTNDEMVNRIQGMTDAVSLNQIQLAGDPTVTTQQLQDMLSGKLARPENMTNLAISGALASRTAQIQAQTELRMATAADIVNEKEVAGLAIQASSDAGLADALGMLLDNTEGNVLLEMLGNGRTTEVATAINQATNGGRDPVMLDVGSGQQIPVAAQDVIATLMGRQEDREIQISTTFMNSQRFNRYSAEVAENERVFRQTQSMLGVPVPTAIRGPMEAGFAAATALYQQAARASTPEERVLLEQEAMLAMENSREMLIDYGRSKGAAEVVLEDIRQGRFTSDETYRAGLLELASGGSNMSNTYLGQAFGDLLRDQNITTISVREWEASGSVDLTDLDRNLTPAKIAGVVDGIGYQVLASAAVSALQGDPAFERLPDQAKAVLDKATDPREQDGVTPGLKLSRLLSAMQMADQMAVAADMAAFKAGEIEQPSYVRGSLPQSLVNTLQQQNVFADFLTPGGRLDRGTAALLTVYNGSKVGGQSSGENAIAFDDLASTAAGHINSAIRQQLVGVGMSDVSAQMAVVRADRRRLVGRIGIDPPRDVGNRGVPNDEAFAESQAAYEQDLANIDAAIMTVYMEKLMDPSRDRSSFLGVNLPSFGGSSAAQVPTGSALFDLGGGDIASAADVADALNRAGNSALATRVLNSIKE